jgi:DNA polymerase
MGDGEIFLSGLTRQEAIRALERAGAAMSERPAVEERAARGDRAPAAGAAAGADTPPWETGLRPDARGSDGAASSRGGRSASEAAASAALPVLPDSYDELREVALGCTRCRLAGSRTQVVFADGSPTARLMVVGEAPGANEDETGLPFVGAAGKFLDLLLSTVDLSRRDSVYICNVLKCRPPGNRNPSPDEIEACSPILKKQIEVVAPEAILAVGSFAAQLLTGREGSALGRLRGEVHAYQGVPLVVTYHPAALLRNANWTRAFWDDLQLLRGILDGSSEHR